MDQIPAFVPEGSDRARLILVGETAFALENTNEFILITEVHRITAAYAESEHGLQPADAQECGAKTVVTMWTKAITGQTYIETGNLHAYCAGVGRYTILGHFRAQRRQTERLSQIHRVESHPPAPRRSTPPTPPPTDLAVLPAHIGDDPNTADRDLVRAAFWFRVRELARSLPKPGDRIMVEDRLSGLQLKQIKTHLNDLGYTRGVSIGTISKHLQNFYDKVHIDLGAQWPFELLN